MQLQNPNLIHTANWNLDSMHSVIRYVRRKDTVYYTQNEEVP